ncbi:hypothetical protein [Spiroplasma endosymbiont of Cleonymus obscurus]|uniref:hypothetical protein n=1 Tax=Spiroplasma endosymbiont of Cleonymus obscurus TaxID=3066324 RepID=UPI0037DC8311
MPFNLSTYNKLIETADDFFEAAVRCGFNDSDKLKKYPLIVPNFTNRAFACELYLKATLYFTKNEIPKEHKIDNLFLKLDERDKKRIYDIWRTIEGQDISDCDYAESMFYDNLEDNSDVFTRFRYVHEWVRSSISLESGFMEKQMHLHSSSTSGLFGSPQVYDGFLEQIAKSIKKYNNELIKLKLIKRKH